jgi:hypothetical protein
MSFVSQVGPKTPTAFAAEIEAALVAIRAGVASGGTVGGTANAITLTLSTPITAYVERQRFRFKAASANTSTTVTLNVDGLGAKTVQRNGAAPAVGFIEAGKIYDVEYDGTNFQCFPVQTALVRSDVLTLGTSVPASGTGVDFTGIPAGTKRITITLSGVSTNGTSNLLVCLGDSGGVEVSGYLGAGSFVASGSSGASTYTAGFGILSAAAANAVHGSITLTLINAASFLWAASGVFSLSNGAQVCTVAGTKALSAELDRVRVTTVSGDTFDAGTINIAYE